MEKWQNGGDKETYLKDRRIKKQKSTVYAARKRCQEEKFVNLRSVEEKNLIFKAEARKMKNQNQDIVVRC